MLEYVKNKKNIIPASPAGGFSLIRSSVFALLLIFISNSFIYGQNTDVEDESQPTAKNVDHNFYLGGKLGLIYVFGIETNYILQSQGVNRLYLAGAVQTSFVVNSINAGGGFFLGKTKSPAGHRFPSAAPGIGRRLVREFESRCPDKSHTAVRH